MISLLKNPNDANRIIGQCFCQARAMVDITGKIPQISFILDQTYFGPNHFSPELVTKMTLLLDRIIVSQLLTRVSSRAGWTH